jgi:hypothetical protein
MDHSRYSIWRDPVTWGMFMLLGVLVVLGIIAGFANARDSADWETIPPDVREWYRGLMQPDNYNVSCCGEADAYWADLFEVSSAGEYVAIITDDREVTGRPHIEPGTKIVVPNHKLKYDAGNPTGHGVIFMSAAGVVYCYVAPSGI